MRKKPARSTTTPRVVSPIALETVKGGTLVIKGDEKFRDRVDSDLEATR